MWRGWRCLESRGQGCFVPLLAGRGTEQGEFLTFGGETPSGQDALEMGNTMVNRGAVVGRDETVRAEECSE